MRPISRRASASPVTVTMPEDGSKVLVGAEPRERMREMQAHQSFQQGGGGAAPGAVGDEDLIGMREVIDGFAVLHCM